MDAQNNQPNEEQFQPEQEHYVPRPAWQVWGARVGLVLFLIFVVLYYLNIFGGHA